MNRGKKIEAENLNVVLSSLCRQPQSGLLEVECLQDGRKEKGELYILAGQPVYARAGKLTGQEALNYLLLWRSVFFSFDTDAPRPPANLSSRAAASVVPAPGTFFPPTSPHATLVARNQEIAAPQKFIPHKIGPVQQVLSLPLAHRQRLIYLLIDGQRTIADISRCSGKSLPEVEEILRELQFQGIIAISPISTTN